ncbi:DNA topoisomerase VI subunit B [Candidatus Thorarchaeota archaeon]|nr:MAG: DNA topoisomerase VI subunit B [Candidatus Thorarchaeota archaeon]
MLTPKSYGQDVVELSVSAWFYRNKAIAGFDNPARSLYVAIRELVENSLDACEDARVLPEVTVLLRRKEDVSGLDILSQGPEVFELIIKDNGTGIPHKKISRLLGKMLTGTKFTQRQSRGTFGLGGSLALLYGQVTTQEPIEIVTGQKGKEIGHQIKMRLDIDHNEPIIIEDQEISKSVDEHGTMVSFHLQGDWIRSKRRIVDYFTQTAIIVPNASLFFEMPDNEILKFDRVIELIQEPSKESKPHPKGIDVEMLKSIIALTKKTTLKSFMMSTFQRVGDKKAEEFLEFIGFDKERRPDSLQQEELVRVMNALEYFDGFLPPSAHSLSPAGIEILMAGTRRLNPEFVVFRQRPPTVNEGHPFIIETGIAYGGEIGAGISLIRFANRIPLLYDERSDVTYRVVRDLNLKNYGLRPEDPITFVMHICSTKIPYKTVGKEYIGDIDVVRKEIELGFKDCLRELGEKLRKRHRVQREHRRENRLITYYRFVAETLQKATGREVSINALFRELGGEEE